AAATAGDVILMAARPTTIIDGDSAANKINEYSAKGTLVGIDADAISDNAGGGSIIYSLTNNAGGRFAIDAASGVVSLANSALIDYADATSHQITVRATNALGAFVDKTFTIAVGDVEPVIQTGGSGADKLFGSP